jgi:rhamnosyltransferase
MKLAAVVISYYPNNVELINNIDRYIDSVEKLIIWENTPLQDREKYKIAFPESDKVVYMGTSKNEGIAYALNRSFEWAIQQGYTHIMTMDQDSLWKDYPHYKTQVQKLENEHSISVFAPVIIDNFSKITLRCNNEDFVITSGSIYCLSAFQKIGHFREDFFIDEVDNEFCVRSKKNGYKIKIITDTYLYQVFGQRRSSKGLSKYTANYSAIRLFYQIRNRIWVWLEYSKMLSYRYLLRTLLLVVMRQSIIIILCESDKINKLKAIIKGLYCGFFQRRKII